MNSLPTLSHRLFAAALAGPSDTSFFSGTKKNSASAESSGSGNRNQHEPKNSNEPLPSGASQRWLAAAGADGI
jgi:hypothetical protein